MCVSVRKRGCRVLYTYVWSEVAGRLRKADFLIQDVKSRERRVPVQETKRKTDKRFPGVHLIFCVDAAVCSHVSV